MLPLLRFLSPTALPAPGTRLFPEIPSSGTVRPCGFPPLRRLAAPETLWPCFMPLTLLGFPAGPLPLAVPLSAGRAATPDVTSPGLSLLLRPPRVGVAFPPALHRRLRRRKGTPLRLSRCPRAPWLPVPCFKRGATRPEPTVVRRVLQGLDRRRFGVPDGANRRCRPS